MCKFTILQKKLKLSIVLLLGIGLTVLQAQNTIPASGGNATGTGGSVSYTVGQIVYTKSAGSNGSSAQGVQQPYEISVPTALEEAKGISLEKVNPHNNSMEQTSWHSASGSSGWGTPGAVNSVYNAMPSNDDRLQFSATRISPDNDGTDDVLTLKLDLSGNGNVITVLIFDENGTRVRKLTENLLSGPETYLTWDGTDDNNSLLPGGIYVILVTLFNDTGRTERWKRVCTIIR